jgi:hypothetical protein
MDKYTKEVLSTAASQCNNITDFLNLIGASLTSMSSRAFIKKKCSEYGIDISHFKQRRPGSDNTKKHFSEILVYDRNQGRRENSFRLKKALKESGRNYICEVCTISPIWNGKSLNLEVDHIDNNPINNIETNLMFICPNCHSQKSTPTCGTNNLHQKPKRG